jgi:hypothetical protein
VPAAKSEACRREPLAILTCPISHAWNTIRVWEKLPMPPATSEIVVTQANPAALTTVHNVSNPVVLPDVTTSPAATFRFRQVDANADIQEFLFKVEKGGSVFWVGAAIHKDTTDLTRAQVFFHPTVVQQVGKVVHVHAADNDYRDFKGGWSGSLQRYVALQGGQLAAAGRMLPLLVPFTTMAALGKGPNMFSNRPVDTLNAIMDAIANEIVGAAYSPGLSSVGAASFSSGFMALGLFLGQMRSSGLIKEVIDFDGPFIVNHPKTLMRSPGAVSKSFTQFALSVPPSGWVTLKSEHFDNVTAFGGNLHAQIGWMMYHQAMLNSVIT